MSDVDVAVVGAGAAGLAAAHALEAAGCQVRLLEAQARFTLENFVPWSTSSGGWYLSIVALRCGMCQCDTRASGVE